MAAFILLVSILGVLMVARSSQAQERIGCFSFNHDNTVLSVKTQDPVGSITECIQQCQNQSATYAGIRNGFQCYCGDSHDHTVNGEQLSNSRCTTTCNDIARLCGGQFSIVIYSVCSRGRYYGKTNDEPNCDKSCNCADNHICLYNTGSCPFNCETGWAGEACNVTVLMPTTQTTTIQSEDEDLASSDGVSEIMTTYLALPVTPCDGCSVVLVALCVTSVALVISIIVNIYLVYRQRVARTPGKQSSAKNHAIHNNADGYINDTHYENMGGVQTEPSNYEHLGSRQTKPATYEELGIAGPTRG